MPFTVSMFRWSGVYVDAFQLGYSVHLNHWLSCFVLLFLVVLAIEWFFWSKNHTWLLYLNPTGSVWGLVFIGRILDCWELFPCFCSRLMKPWYHGHWLAWSKRRNWGLVWTILFFQHFPDFCEWSTITPRIKFHLNMLKDVLVMGGITAL